MSLEDCFTFGVERVGRKEVSPVFLGGQHEDNMGRHSE